MKTRMKITIAFVAVMVLSFTGYNVYKTQKAIQLSDVAKHWLMAKELMPAIVIWKILGVQKEVINIFAIVKLIKIQSIHVHLQWSLGGMMIISRIGVLNKVGL